MVFWVMLLVNVITFLVTELLRPKPNIENAKPAGLGDFQVPTATEGRVVPIIWGRVKIAGPNVTWYGDLIADPITQKVKTGMFSSETQTIGFRYSIGVMMSLVRGPVDLLVNIRNDDSFVWGAEAPSADAPVVPSDAGAAYFIDEPGLFGGDDAGGGGGLIGGGNIFKGSETQAISAYLAQFQVPTPAYRGTCFITFERGEIGLSPQLRNFEFELQRIPDGLDLATLQPGDEEIDLGANPMNVIFEVLNNSEWGLNVSSGKINLVSLRAIAATMKAEGNGFAWVWDRQLNVVEVIRLIQDQVDGVLFVDPVTGDYDFKLVRLDYTPGTLPLLDESNVVSVDRFQRPAWAETTNIVTAEFTDRRKNYTQSFALAQDMANVEIVQAVNTAGIKFPGVKNPTLANTLVWREIRQLSFPVATGQLVSDRSQWDLTPGDTRELTWGRLGLVRLPIRILQVDRGEILKNRITINFTQDIFSINASTFTDPIDTGWIPVSSEAKPSLRERLWEVPFQLSLDNDRHLAVICSRDGGLHTSFDVFADRSGGPTFLFEGTESDFTPTALITAAISRDKGDILPFTQDIEVDGINDVTLAELTAAASATIDPNNPRNVFLIDEELFFFESVLDLGAGVVRLETCHAGLFDTVPADHVDDSVAWFVGFGLGLLQRAGALPDSVTSVAVKILPTTIRNQLDIGLAATLAATVGQRIKDPIPPGDPFMNGNRFHDLDGWTRTTGTLDFTWNTRNRETQAFDTKQDDPDLQQSGDVGAHVIVRRVDTSAAVIDFSNIFSDQFIKTGFLPQSSPGIPDELDFTAEISNKTVAGAESQIVTSREFEIFGFGIDFGADFGGEAPNNGIVLSQGAPPFTPEPIPGSGRDRIWTLDFLGAMNAGEDRRYIVSMTDTLNQQSVLGAGFFTPFSSFPTLEAVAEHAREELQAIAEFPAEPMPFTITREGTRVIITTRFGDLTIRMVPDGVATGARFTPGAHGIIQEAAPPSTPVRQVVFFDWFKRDFDDPTAQNDLLSPTNDPAFAIVASAAPNKNTFFINASTWEQFQEIGGDNSEAFTIGKFQDGLSTARDQDIPEFYDQILSQDATRFFATVEGPLALRGGLDNPMQRTGIVIEMADNYEIRPQTILTAVDGGGVAFNAGGFKFLAKEGTPAVPGLATGLTHVVSAGIGNTFSPTPGAILSYTLDGTVFSEVLPAIPPAGTNLRAAWIDLLDAVDLDPRFEVVNRVDEVDRFSLFATIKSSSFNTPFEAFGDIGAGLRVEFRDISP